MILATELITPSQVYWITRLDGIQHFFRDAGITTLLMCPLCIFLFAMGRDMGWTDAATSTLKRAAVASFVLCTIFQVGRIATPSTKEAILIYGLPAIVNNDKVQQKASDAIDGTADLLKLAKGYVAEKLKTEESK